MDISEDYKDFILKLLKLAANNDVMDILNWTEDLEFYINCNDIFFWACSDAEPISPNTLPQLEQAFKDGEGFDGALLYCARQRKMRPQGAFYTCIDKEHWHLFDECGPQRETDFMNPRERPEP